MRGIKGRQLAAVAFFCWTLLAGMALAQSPPNGVPCHAISSQGAVTLCQPGWTYGCQATSNTNNILGTDGNRTSIQFQNTGPTPTTLTFGDSAVVNVNGFQVQPSNSYIWSNVGRGNEPGRISTAAVSVITTAGASNTCTFMFTD